MPCLSALYEATSPTTANPDTAATLLASPTGSPAITSALAFSDDQFLTVSSLGAPYAIDELLHLTLGGGGSVNLAASTTLTQTAVPEPASIALLGGALLLVSGIRRKRNQSQKA